MDNFAEKRKFLRLNALVDVVYSKTEVLAEDELSLAKNISKGGICLIAYEELEENDVLDLKIFLPEDKEPINVRGRVIWVKEFIVGDTSYGERFDVGVEFIKIKDEDLARINNCVFRHK